MGNLTPAEIIDEIADRFSNYVGRGVALDVFIEELETNIQNLSELLELYFVLTGQVLEEDVKSRSAVDGPIENLPESWDVGVLDFVTLLPHRVSDLETTTRKETVRYKGEVRGQIDWQATIKQRSRSPGSGGQLFACRERHEVVLTDENRVLLTLLANVEQIVTRFAEQQGKDLSNFDWFSAWFDDTKPRRVMTQVLERNPYLSDIGASPEAVSARTLRAGSRSRNPLYREAATLLEMLQRLQSGELTEAEAERILSMMFFGPSEEDDDTLFELYWALELLETFVDQNPTYYQITQSTDLVAEWKTEDARYQLFHDWSGTHGDRQLLSFARTVEDIETDVRFDEPPKYLARTKEAIQSWGELASEVTGSESLQFKTGLPDIVLLRYDRTLSTLTDVFLGEVKFSSDTRTVKRGLRELLEYANYAKVGRDVNHEIHDRATEYLVPDANPFGSPHISLGLFTEKPALKTTNPEDGLTIYRFQDSVSKPFSGK